MWRDLFSEDAAAASPSRFVAKHWFTRCRSFGKLDAAVNISIPPSLRVQRDAVSFDRVTLGYTTVHLYPASALREAQSGYGVTPGEEDPDWEESWLVIGMEDCTGDPIFVDIEDEDFPVYTCAPDMSEWTPELIANSFQNFIEILDRIRLVARGRENPEALAAKPLTEEECDGILDFIRQNNPDVSLSFWEVLLEPAC